MLLPALRCEASMVTWVFTQFPWAVSSIYPKDPAGMTQGWGVLVLKMTPVCEGVRILGVWYICSPTFGSWGVAVLVDTPNTRGPLVVNIPYIESLGFSNVQNPYLTFPLGRISAPILCTANDQGMNSSLDKRERE